MTVVVNCRFLTQGVTGVQRFAEEITKRLPDLVPGLLLVAPHGSLRKNSLGGLEVHQFGKLRGHGWEQLELGGLVRRRHATLLSLANTGPLMVARQVLVIHDLAWLHLPESYSFRFRVAYRSLTRSLVRQVDQLVTVSEFSRRDIATRYHLNKSSIAVVSNAVDDRFRTSLGLRPRGFPEIDYFLVVSSLNKHKNIGPFVEAYRRYEHSSGTATRLVLAGGSSDVFSQDRTLALLSVSNGSLSKRSINYEQSKIVALGRVTDEELIWLYRHAKAFVFPSLFEGFGLPPLEAQVCGCLVASSDAASLPEVLGDGALYFDAHSQCDMQRMLRDLDQDRAFVPHVDNNRGRPVQSWQSSASVIASLLKSK